MVGAMIESKGLQDACARLEQAANERPGMGTALRVITEVLNAEVTNYEGDFDEERFVEQLVKLANALVEATLARPNHASSAVMKLLVELVSITVGEGDDLSRMVDVQAEARRILDGWK